GRTGRGRAPPPDPGADTGDGPGSPALCLSRRRRLRGCPQCRPQRRARGGPPLRRALLGPGRAARAGPGRTVPPARPPAVAPLGGHRARRADLRSEALLKVLLSPPIRAHILPPEHATRVW